MDEIRAAEAGERFARFLDRATAVAAPALCPELRLHAARDLESLWAQHEAWTGRLGSPPPYWGVAWPGGQALARYLLDHPGVARGRTVLDFGSGSGLCAIAAARAGAGAVTAADADPFSRLAIAANARLNGVRVDTARADLLGAPARWELVVAGDVWYDRFLAQAVTPWLRALARSGATVLVGDIGRAHFPRTGLIELASYAIATSPSFERDVLSAARVWSVSPDATARRL